MNPFEEDIITNNTDNLKLDNIIEVWVEDRGRKADTYISGLPLSKEELFSHLKTIKKNKGCNGSIKDVVKEDGLSTLMIHIQGNQKDYLKEYFNSLGYNNIKLKG